MSDLTFEVGLSHRAPHQTGASRRFPIDKAFNPDQPRDDRGRWSSGGASEQGPQSGPDLDHAAALNAGPLYVSSREEEQRIVDAHFAAHPNTLPAPGERPRAVLLLGPPASGKSSVAAQAVAGRERLLPIDADHIQSQLAGYRPELAPTYHDAGSTIADKLIAGRAMREGRNLELQWLGKNEGKLRAAVERLHTLGYQVELIYTHVTPEESVNRVVERFRNPKDGRYLPPEYVRGIGDRPERSYDAVKDSLEPGDRWAKYSNMVARGEKPRLIERGEVPWAEQR